MTVKDIELLFIHTAYKLKLQSQLTTNANYCHNLLNNKQKNKHIVTQTLHKHIMS